jgi:alanine racemase
LKLELSHSELCSAVDGKFLQASSGNVDIVIYDTRKITTSRDGVFFAFVGHRDGHAFAQKAYDRGVRCFVVSKQVDLPRDASIIIVENTLYAFQELAKHHRNRFTIPVVAITGSLGKTTIKEWLYYLLKDEFKVGRTPKSYNSQLGVAQSLLELNEDHEIALIEADISHPGEMDRLEEIISPTLGIFTGIGKYYEQNFESKEAHLNEHLKLFKHANFTFILEEYHSQFRRNKIGVVETSVLEWKSFGIDQQNFPENRALCLKAADFLGVEHSVMKERIAHLPVLSGRQEVFEGINGNLIINDTYNMDVDALEQALEYQFASKERTKKIVVLDLSHVDALRKAEILDVVKKYGPAQTFLVEGNELPAELMEMTDASILFKSSFHSNLKVLVQKFKNRKHETWVEFDFKAIRSNLRYLQSLLPKGTKTLVMVKASSYGTGDVKIPHFLQEHGADYLGVAYTDEGATLRENGIELPILVMNSEPNAFEDLFVHQLEPAIHGMEQLKRFITLVEQQGLTDYPIHLKVETGMNRLGFERSTIDEALDILKSTEAVRLVSVFSHLADADNSDESYSRQQITRFSEIKKQVETTFKHKVMFHILNSEGALRFSKEASFDMVRFGIGIFGYASNQLNLLPSIHWKTSVSQIKHLQPGDSIGYGRTFIASSPMTIATIRVGYADGFRRSLSNGVGQVVVNGVFCPVVGNVCMDMTMIDVTNVPCSISDEVEIIGETQTLQDFSKMLETIPYEVMTSINKRVARVYVRS